MTFGKIIAFQGLTIEDSFSQGADKLARMLVRVVLTVNRRLMIPELLMIMMIMKQGLNWFMPRMRPLSK